MSEERPNFLTSMKKASQRFASTVADAGARTMLKTDVAFLERDIKARKQALGIEVYDILKAEDDSDDGGGGTSSSSSSSSSSEIREAFDECRADIRHLEARVSSKRGEMEAIERSSGHASSGGGSVGVGGGMDDAETPGIPSTP